MSKSFHKFIFIISIFYLILVSGFLVWHRSWFSPDQFFGAALIGALFLGRFLQFIRDWSFPVILFLSYEYLRSLVPILALKAHVYPMIYFDEKIFGILPTIQLQDFLFSDGSVHWYDYFSMLLYLSHFIVPFISGFVFWIVDRNFFKEYFFGLLLVSYLAFITFVLFPAVPPWLASQNGYIPYVVDIKTKVFASFAQPMLLPTIYKFFGANLVAAVPSLHAAYPWLTFLFLFKRFKLWAFLVFPYVFGVWFSLVYLGEHYVFDILAGVIYASFAFAFVQKSEKLNFKLLPVKIFKKAR